MMTLQELEIIRDVLIGVYFFDETVHMDEALEIVCREIDQMTQDQLLSASKANPT